MALIAVTSMLATAAPQAQAQWRAVRRGAALGVCSGLLAMLGACANIAALKPPVTPAGAAAITGSDLIVVAVVDSPELRPAPGSAARAAGYNRAAGYAGGGRALALADSVATQHGLTEIKAWTIPTLDWRCMLYRLPAGTARGPLLAQLAADPRVALAQPLNTFETLTDTRPAAPNTPTPQASAYNDPYLSLQDGFFAIDAAGAQRVTRGDGTQVAVIDTGIDLKHPDLQGRVALVRDFVGNPAPGERHGTEVAGVIAAAANNGVGIVGVAPGTQLLSLRSCWATGTGSEPARCNSFTLAQGLVAAMAAGADIINLSLGGPRDPLLERLVQQALDRGTVVVGAVPGSGRREGFPTGMPGVLAVAMSEDGAPARGQLAAPGRRILTLAPGGGYDYATGSSLATAHVSGTAALLRSVNHRLDGAELQRLLGGDTARPIDACRALQRLDARTPTVCTGPR
jgi:hypothetical protein